MKLYPKKLRNMKDLDKERKLLHRELAQLDEEDVLSLDGILGRKKNKDDDGDDGGGIIDLLGMLPVSNPLFTIGLKAAKGLITMMSSRSVEDDDAGPGRKSQSKKRKHPIRAVALEVIGGYLKWKAIELSYKGIKHLVKKRREKKEQQ